MRWFLTIMLLISLSVFHVIFLGKVTEERITLPKDESSYVLPSQVVKITALGFDGLVSDFMFLNAVNFIGSISEKKESARVIEFEWKWWLFSGPTPEEEAARETESEWKWLSKVLDTATDLDPYFADPYYFASGYLAWNASTLQEANALLEKGSRYRTWDPLIPFYLGFNYFYFLHNNEKASEWIMKAARRPGASTAYASLAAKLAYKERKTENAIAFLEEVIRMTEDDGLRNTFETRVEALKAVLVLEQARSLYKKKFGTTPKRLDALIEKRVIAELPRDPYGGTFYLDDAGNVRSTTESNLLPYQH
jgi:tetratricopeptide (TPR) repeat protein